VSPARQVRVEARAKLNLGLAVGPLRSDAFHEIATVFQSIDLADTLVVRRRARGFRLAIRWEDVSIRGRARTERLAGGRDNLVLRAARAFARHVRFPGGAAFRLVKRIPAGTGLGGGSSDAAATLLGLERLTGVRLDPRSRSALALHLGSDVPFAVRGGTMVGLGRGERLTPTRLTRPFRAVIAVPAWRIATAAAYRGMDRHKYFLTEWSAKLRSAQSLGRALVTAARCMRLGNSFESALGNRKGDFLSLSSRMRNAGLVSPRLTGSGSAVFGILPPAFHLASVLARFEGDERIYAVKSMPSGLRVTVEQR
jgi:4-diphosphocytidyl-2C-methyl-D-erythritol kinase